MYNFLPNDVCSATVMSKGSHQTSRLIEFHSQFYRAIFEWKVKESSLKFFGMPNTHEVVFRCYYKNEWVFDSPACVFVCTQYGNGNYVSIWRLWWMLSIQMNRKLHEELWLTHKYTLFAVLQCDFWMNFSRLGSIETTTATNQKQASRQILSHINIWFNTNALTWNEWCILWNTFYIIYF